MGSPPRKDKPPRGVNFIEPTKLKRIDTQGDIHLTVRFHIAPRQPEPAF